MERLAEREVVGSGGPGAAIETEDLVVRYGRTTAALSSARGFSWAELGGKTDDHVCGISPDKVKGRAS